MEYNIEKILIALSQQHYYNVRNHLCNKIQCSNLPDHFSIEYNVQNRFDTFAIKCNVLNCIITSIIRIKQWFTKTFKVDSMFKIIKYTVTLAQNVQNMNPVQLKLKNRTGFILCTFPAVLRL